MNITQRSHRPNGDDVATIIRLERAITRLGLPLGFDGDPLAERIPEADTEGDLWAACDLLDSLPVELRNRDRRLAYRMCQAAVFGRSRRAEQNASRQPAAAPETRRPRAW